MHSSRRELASARSRQLCKDLATGTQANHSAVVIPTRNRFCCRNVTGNISFTRTTCSSNFDGIACYPSDCSATYYVFTSGLSSSLQTAPAGMVCADGNIVPSNAGLCGTAHRCIGAREGGGQVPEGEVPCPGGGGRRVAAQPASFGARRLGDGGFPAYWTGGGSNVWQTVVTGWRLVSGTIINETGGCR